jgi:hypothetical protein
MDKAYDMAQTAKDAGFKNCFVVKYVNGKRITK